MARDDRRSAELNEARNRLNHIRRGAAGDEPVGDYGEAATSRRPRRTSITPHERRRKQRMISFTFPSPSWTKAIREAAEALDIGVSEFATLVFGQVLGAIERGEWEPDNEVVWKPGEAKNDSLWRT